MTAGFFRIAQSPPKAKGAYVDIRCHNPPSLLVIPQDTHHVQVRRLAAPAVDPLLLLLRHVALLDLLDLAGRGQVRLLELDTQLRFRRRQLTLGPEVDEIRVHVNVELRRVRVDGLGRVVFLLPEEQDLVLRGELFKRGHAGWPAIFELAHGNAGRGREGGEVAFEFFAVGHGVLWVVAEGLFAVGGLVLGDDGDAIVVLECTADEWCVLLKVARKRQEVEDVREGRGGWKSLFEVLHGVHHVGHDLGASAG